MNTLGKIATLSLLIFGIASQQAEAQTEILPRNPEFEIYTTADGLSSRDIDCLYQDHFGFLWVGTLDGLNRYDGYTFKVFQPQTEDSTSISYRAITSILEDKNNTLWIGTDNGLNRYNREKGNFTRYFGNEADNTDYPSWRINKLFLDSKKNLWIGTREGAYTYDYDNDSFVKYSPFKETPFEVRDIEELADGRMAFATERGIVLINTRTLDYSYIKSTPNEPGLRSNNVRRIYEDAFGNLWIGLNHNGIDFFNTKKHKFYPLIHSNGASEMDVGLSANSIQCIEEHNGQLLIGTADGLNLIDPAKANQGEFLFRQIAYDANDPDGLSSNNILTILSNDTTLWIGTRFGGLNMYAPALKKFKHYRHRLYDPHSLSDNQVSSFLEDPKGNIWVGTHRGRLNYFVRNTEMFYPFTSQFPKKLNSTNITHVFYDHLGKMWMPSWGGGLNYADPVTKEVGYYKREPGNPNCLNSNHLFYGIEDSEGMLWFTTSSSGINVFDPNTKKFFQYVPDANQPGTIETLYTRTLYEDKNNTVWVGTYFGLYEFIRESGTFRAYRQDIYHPDSLQSEQINAITEDTRGRLWIGTIGAGLNFYNRENNKFIAITEKDGLSSNVINGILEDDHGNLWVSTNGGISKIVLEPGDTIAVKDITNYDMSDGLQDNQFKWRSYYKSPTTGEMFFGGPNGFNVFHPDSIQANPVVPPVFITVFLLFNKQVPVGTEGSPLEKNIILTEELVLNHEQSVFTLGFVALNYIHPEKNRYAYMLEGFEKEWNYVGSQQNATYTNLPPGNYTFRVKASNNDGVWNEEGKALRIIVLPAWWETLWFRVGVVLLLIGTAFGLYKYRTYRLKQRNKKLEEVVQQRTKELRGAYMELQDSNEEIQAQNEEIFEKSEELEAITEELRKRNEEVEHINTHLEEEVAQRTLELDKAYRELKLTHKELTQFLYRSSHDFRRPLTTIMGLKLLADQYLKEPFARDLFRKVNSTASQMDKMLQKLLMVYDINTLAEPPNLVDFPRMIAKIQSELEEEIKQTKTTFSVSVDVKEPFCSYPTLLNIILYNLLENALRFSSPLDGHFHEVQINITQQNDEIFLDIQDNGRGIRQQHIPQIFDMYFRGHSEVHGNGLGLYIVKKAVDKLEGKITVESGEQEGSRFLLRLKSEQPVEA